MATKFLNRVRMTVAGTPGTGTISLSTQAVGFQSFNAAGMSDGDQTAYLIEDGLPVGSAWEIGFGTWHSNNTFTRDTVTQTSAGGTTKISVTSGAIISSCFRASDLGAGTLDSLTDVVITSPSNGDLLTFDVASGDWKNKRPASSQPQVVQYGTYQNTTNPPVITLAAAPTIGNYIFAMGNGGGGTTTGIYYAGFTPIFPDKQGSLNKGNVLSQYDCYYGIRAVHVGDGASFTMGQIGAGGPTLNAVVVEVSGVDISRCSEFLMNTGNFGSSNTALNSLGPVGSLCLMFAAGDPNTISVVSPTPPQYLANNTNGSSMVFDYDNNTGGYNGLIATMSSGTMRGLVMSLPGY